MTGAPESGAACAALPDAKVTGGTKKKSCPPKPTTVTWCDTCNRIGMRLNEAVGFDETCRYCKKGDVRLKRFPTRKAARKHVEDFREKNPVKKGREPESDGQPE